MSKKDDFNLGEWRVSVEARLAKLEECVRWLKNGTLANVIILVLGFIGVILAVIYH